MFPEKVFASARSVEVAIEVGAPESCPYGKERRGSSVMEETEVVPARDETKLEAKRGSKRPLKVVV